MGAIAVYLLKHVKLITAWAVLIAGFTIFFNAIYRSSAWGYVSECTSATIDLLVSPVEAIPEHVMGIKNAIADALDESNGFAQLMMWVAGFDVLESMFDLIISQIGVITSLCTIVLSGLLVIAGAAWVLRRTQRWVSALSEGELDGAKVLD